jgi:hypothetical protein
MMNVDDAIQSAVIWVPVPRPLPTFYQTQFSDLTRIPLRKKKITPDWRTDAACVMTQPQLHLMYLTAPT